MTVGNSGASASAGRTSLARVAFASAVGSALEWYDFFIYGTAAALVFNQAFFPKFDPAVGTLAAFATFGVGFVARPFGGLFFGHFGDRLGRKPMLVATLLLVGIGTFLIGLLPTYARAGVWAPAALVVLRLVQGFGAGAEYGGAVIFAVEHAPPGRRGVYGSWAPIGVVVGNLLAVGVFALVSLLAAREIYRLGLAAAVPDLDRADRSWALCPRPGRRNPDFHRSGRRARADPAARRRGDPPPSRSFVVVIGARLAENGLGYLFPVFGLSYVAGTLHLPREVGLLGVLLGNAFAIAGVAYFSWLSDRVGRRPVYLGGALFSAAFAFPFFWLVNTRSTALIVLAFVCAMAIGGAAMFGPQAAYFSELFGPRLRYSGFAFARELGSILAGGPAPFLSALLVLRMGGKPWGVALYIIALSLITAASIWIGPETFTADPHAEHEPRPAQRGRRPQADVQPPSPTAAARGEQPVDHGRRGAEIVGRIGQGAQFLGAERPGDGRGFEQYVEQGPVGLDRRPAGVIDEIMRLVAAGVRGQPHHHRFRHDQAMRHGQVSRHPAGIDAQPAQQEPRLAERPGGIAEGFRQRHPLEMPRAGRALEIGDERIECQAGMLAQDLGRGEDQLAGNRIALLRHRRARAAAGGKGFGRLAELGRRHQHQVIGDLGEAAGDEGQHLDRLGDAVAGGVPGDRRVAERQFPSELGAALDRFIAPPERGQRAGGAAELDDEHARAQFAQTVGVAIEGREPDRGLVAEGNRQGVLQMGAAGERQVAVAAREIGEMAAHRGEILFDQPQSGADLQHRSGIHDVLGRRPPMQPAPGGAGGLGELADQRQDRIADGLGLGLEPRPVEPRRRIGRSRDRRRRLRGDDAEPGLGARQRRLDLDTAGEEPVAAEHALHLGRAEQVGEDRAVEHADRHRTPQCGADR